MHGRTPDPFIPIWLQLSLSPALQSFWKARLLHACCVSFILSPGSFMTSGTLLFCIWNGSCHFLVLIFISALQNHPCPLLLPIVVTSLSCTWHFLCPTHLPWLLGFSEGCFHPLKPISALCEDFQGLLPSPKCEACPYSRPNHVAVIDVFSRPFWGPALYLAHARC